MQYFIRKKQHHEDKTRKDNNNKYQFSVYSLCISRIGLGVCCLVVITFVTIYYMIIIAWIIFYFVASFLPRLGWGYCDHEWNSDGMCFYNIFKSYYKVFGAMPPTVESIVTFLKWVIYTSILICLHLQGLPQIVLRSVAQSPMMGNSYSIKFQRSTYQFIVHTRSDTVWNTLHFFHYYEFVAVNKAIEYLRLYHHSIPSSVNKNV